MSTRSYDRSQDLRSRQRTVEYPRAANVARRCSAREQCVQRLFGEPPRFRVDRYKCDAAQCTAARPRAAYPAGHSGYGETPPVWKPRYDADRRKDEFLATLVHELRNPLATIRSGIDVVKLTPEDTQLIRETCDLIERNSPSWLRWWMTC
ncbi:MAG: histidine kinase dimerization/phospho-acceptor domain-containing protein [Pirellulaceae bacterium]